MLNKQHSPLLASIMAFLANQQNGSLTSTSDGDTCSMNTYAIRMSYIKKEKG
ncbi:MAG: hypothetical protein LBG19_11180 [Prevotellaceae bacterium]|nr:hypothetical protein [Prevotellaceae bacterium]